MPTGNSVKESGRERGREGEARWWLLRTPLPSPALPCPPNAGEIIETSGGRVQCLGPQGQDLDTLRRHHVGRALRVGRNLYTLNASAPEDRWPEVELILRGIVASFRN